MPAGSVLKHTPRVSLPHCLSPQKASYVCCDDELSRGRITKMFALPHSGVLWPPRLPTPFPDVRGQLYRGSSRALQLHRQADSGGKRHPHVWAGRALDRLPAPLLRYGAWHGGGVPKEHLANGRWTSSQDVSVIEGQEESRPLQPSSHP